MSDKICKKFEGVAYDMQDAAKACQRLAHEEGYHVQIGTLKGGIGNDGLWHIEGVFYKENSEAHVNAS